MSYDRPNRIKYSFGLFDFGAGSTEEFIVRGPKGKKGRLWDYGVEGVTEVMNGSSTEPEIAVGTSTNPDAYGEEIDLDGLAVNKAKSVRIDFDEIADATDFDALMVDRDLPADTDIYITCTGAAGSPTGIAVPFVIIDWDL